MKRFLNYHVFTLFLRLLSVFLIYFLCRVLFFFFNKSLFTDVGFVEFLGYCFWGIRFDLVAILYLNLLFIILSLIPFKFRINRIYQEVLLWIFILINSVGIIFNVLDFGYYPFILQRTTANVFHFIQTENNLLALLVNLGIEFWHVPLSGVLLLLLFIYLNKKLKSKTDFNIKNGFVFFVVNSIILGLAIGLSIVGIRGGIRKSVRPINISNAAIYTNNPINTALILNTPFSIIRTFRHKEAKRIKFFSKEQLDSIYSVRNDRSDTLQLKKVNIVFLILESFGKEYSGYLNPHLENGNYKGYMPFLDSLMSESKVFVNAYANGRKSIDAIPSLVAGIPSLGNPYITSHHSNNTIKSLPLLLQKEGYSSAFYHGAPVGSMGFDAFCNVAQFDNYYGMENFEKKQDFTGDVWGVFDEEFMQFFAKGLTEMKQPFFGTLFSLSSHSPYVVPKRYKNKFPKGPLGIHETVGYTDYALKKFFETIKKEPWFKNTLFIISPDHCSVPYYPEYKNAAGFFSIPIIFHHPNDSTLKGIDSTYTQQIDVLPTVLNYLDYNKNYFAFGNDANDSTQKHFSINYLNGNYQIFMDGYLLLFDLKNEVAFYNLKIDKLLQKNIQGTLPEKEDEMLKLCKVFIQQYNNRLLNNKFTLE